MKGSKSWDEKAEDYASAHHTLEHQRLAYNMRQWAMFVHGARWQREHLLSEETVERAALALYRYKGRHRDTAWTALHEVSKTVWRERARAVLTAALGEEE